MLCLHFTDLHLQIRWGGGGRGKCDSPHSLCLCLQTVHDNIVCLFAYCPYGFMYPCIWRIKHNWCTCIWVGQTWINSTVLSSFQLIVVHWGGTVEDIGRRKNGPVVTNHIIYIVCTKALPAVQNRDGNYKFTSVTCNAVSFLPDLNLE